MSVFRQNRKDFLEFAKFANLEAQNRGILAIGDISPAQIFHRQREAQNRGFGDISPEMATLVQFNMRVLVIVLIRGRGTGEAGEASASPDFRG